MIITIFSNTLVIDSTGKIPDGIFAHTLNLCQWIEENQMYLEGLTCQSLANLLAGLVGLDVNIIFSTLSTVSVPYGNTNAMGSFEECIACQSNISQPTPFQIPDFKGTYAPLKIYTDIPENQKSKLTRIGGGISIIGGNIPIVLQNVKETNFNQNI